MNRCYILLVYATRLEFDKDGLLVPVKDKFEGVDLKDNEYFLRKVLYIDNKFIDFETSEEMFYLENDEGHIYANEILYENTYYILNVIKDFTPTKKDILRAETVYEKYIEKEELFKDSNIIRMPKRRLN